MHKTRTMAMLLLAAAMLFSCGKETPNEITPTDPTPVNPAPADPELAFRKVASVQQEVFEGEEGGYTHTTTFLWEGDKVVSAKRDGRDYARFFYDGDLLWQVVIFNEDANDTITLYREGGFVSMEVISTYDIEATTTTTSDDGTVIEGETTISRYLDTVHYAYADGRLCLVDYGSVVYRFEWSGNNLSKIMYNEGSEWQQEMTGLTYDAKHDPFAAYDWSWSLKSLPVEAGSIWFMGDNNLVSGTLQTQGEDDEPFRFEYTYDGDWPQTMTCYLHGESAPDWKLTFTYAD